MEPQETSSAKCRKLDTTENDSPDDQLVRRTSGYASKVSRLQYLDERTADKHFVFENTNKRVPAHKSVLSKASKVFDRMLYGSVDGVMAVEGDVLLPGKSPESFEDFLQFCYLDEVLLRLDNITDVMSLAHEYEMIESLELCGRFWADHWTIDDICSAYSWAINFHMNEFKAFCERKISIHCQAIFRTPGFLSCSFNVLKHILELDSLLCDESMVLGACLDWARYACEQDNKDANDMNNLRYYLKNDSDEINLLYKIRFGSMTHKEFIKHMDANDGIFSDVREYEDVMRLLLGSKNLKTDKFKTEPRKAVHFSWDENCALESKVFLCPPTRRQLNTPRIVTVLTSNRPILLGGFYNVPMSRSSYNYSNSYAISVQVSIKAQPIGNNVENIIPKLIHTDRITLSDHSETYFKLECKPVVIRPDFEYLIEFHFDTSSISYSPLTLQREIQLHKDVTIHVHPQGDDSIIKRFKFNLL